MRSGPSTPHPRLGATFVAFMRAEWMLAFGSAALAEADAREAIEQRGPAADRTRLGSAAP